MKSKWVAPLFYLGTLISSVGSLTFSVCLIAFMLQSGFELWQASLIVGFQRLIPVVATGIWGHLTDELKPQLTIFWCEIVAAFTSVALLIIWKANSTPYLMLLALCVARAVIVSFQTGSRTKLAKALSDDSYSSNSKNAIWFNKATQGATLFSGLIAWFIIQHSNFEMAVLLDFATFALNGLIVFKLPIASVETDKSVADTKPTASWRQKFKDLYHYNPKAATLDLILAVCMMGTMAFMSRAAQSDQTWIGKYMASFGLAVWVAGFLERKVSSRISSFPFWMGLGFSFIILALSGAPSWITLGIFFIKDLCYWILLHRISSYIQSDSPLKLIGSISSARMAIMVAILGLGEVIVGAWSSLLPLWGDAGLRGALAIAVGLVVVFQSKSVGAPNDRPTL